jgi:ubiquinone/menaquinone biosynthesis C-methylase UbiE
MDEELKYESAWKSGQEHNSRTALPFAEFVAKTNFGGSMLDLGCGNGLVVSYLHSKGFNIRGADITLAGLDTKYISYDNGTMSVSKAGKELFVKAPLWEMPFENNEFDLTFSCDVLEHIPQEYVENVLKEICRITKTTTYHIIATFEDRDFHPTVQPIEWWQEQFSKVNNNKCKVQCVSRKEFLFKKTGYMEIGL